MGDLARDKCRVERVCVQKLLYFMREKHSVKQSRSSLTPYILDSNSTTHVALYAIPTKWLKIAPQDQIYVHWFLLAGLFLSSFDYCWV